MVWKQLSAVGTISGLSNNHLEVVLFLTPTVERNSVAIGPDKDIIIISDTEFSPRQWPPKLRKTNEKRNRNVLV